MSSEARVGGIAALIQALCYVVGFALLLTAMNPGDTTGWTSLQKLEFVLERAALFQLWNLIIYVVFGVALGVLAVVLHRRFGDPDRLLMAVATPFAMIWAGLVIASGMLASVGLSAVAERIAAAPDQAAALWATLGVVQNGLGGGVELVGGLWVLLLSAASRRSARGLPKWVDAVGFIVGLAGIATVVPMLSDLGAVFGLAQIVWFAAIAIVLFRTPPSDAV